MPMLGDIGNRRRVRRCDRDNKGTKCGDKVNVCMTLEYAISISTIFHT
jgi:hypothetical protein